jgi:hypothetical protein
MENRKTFELTDGGGKKAFVAEITGLHAKFKFERQFCGRGEQERNSRYRTFEIDRDRTGVFEYRTYSAKGNPHGDFFKFVEGKFTPITEEEVKTYFAEKEVKQSERSASGRCPECDLWLPEHDPTCALDEAYFESSGVEQKGRERHNGRKVWDKSSPGSGLTSDELLERTNEGSLSWSDAMNTDF